MTDTDLRRHPRRLLVGLLAAAAAAAAVAAPLPAAADDLTCTGAVGAQTVDGNVLVPSGASCSLQGTTVQGNVLVGPGATLDADGVTVDGNIQDDDNDAGDVTVTGSQVDGNIQLEQGAGVTVTDTTVNGDVQPNFNTGGVTINSNIIGGNLQCEGNDPAPTGGGNTVHGDAEGQCAALTGDGGDDGGNGGDGGDRATSRLSGADRFATSAAIADRSFPDGADVVYLARADNAADALSGGSLTDGPVLLVPSCGGLPEVIGAAIERLDPREVIALGGTNAVCPQILQAASTR